jgi:hypothetical protein
MQVVSFTFRLFYPRGGPQDIRRIKNAHNHSEGAGLETAYSPAVMSGFTLRSHSPRERAQGYIGKCPQSFWRRWFWDSIQYLLIVFQSLRLVCSSSHELLILGITVRIFLMQWFALAFCIIVFRYTVGLLWTRVYSIRALNPGRPANSITFLVQLHQILRNYGRTKWISYRWWNTFRNIPCW